MLEYPIGTTFHYSRSDDLTGTVTDFKDGHYTIKWSNGYEYDAYEPYWIKSKCHMIEKPKASKASKASKEEIDARIAASQAKRVTKIRPNPKYSIAALEARGYTVRVWHHRNKLHLADVVPERLRPILQQGFINLAAIPVCITQEGGDTTVKIFNSKNGFITYSTAMCHPKEAYWKKLGISVCIESAAKRHEELEAALSAEPNAATDESAESAPADAVA